MNTKFLYTLLLVVTAACLLAVAQDAPQPTNNNNNQGSFGQFGLENNPDCPIRKSINKISDMFQRMRPSPTTNGGIGGYTATLGQQQVGLSRRKRQISSLETQIQPTTPAIESDTTAATATTPEQQAVADYHETIAAHGNRLNQMIERLRNSPYMPNQEQSIQLLSVVLTLAIVMMFTIMFGPVAGAQAALIQGIVKQVVPLIVAAGVHYAAPLLNGERSAITDVPLHPVQVHQPTFGKVI